MGKFIPDKYHGYYLYITSSCGRELIVHVHAHPDDIGSERTAAKFWVFEDGTSELVKLGCVKPCDVKLLQKWIYKNMDYIKKEWQKMEPNAQFKKKK